ncbi:MAG: AraC family transcriptional regulator [Lachnospiraceae bacterium]|nr:AraC family transcriptional regulator [Lachnospiraceae bacterium]
MRERGRGTAKYQIIVLDNEIEAADRAAKIIEKNEKYTNITVLTDAQYLKQAVQELEPILIITAVNVNGVDGIQICSRIKQDWPDIRVIVSSEHSIFELLRAAMKNGADDYVTKPYSERLLVDAVHRSIDNYEKEYQRMIKAAEQSPRAKEILTYVGYSFMDQALITGGNKDFSSYRSLLNLGKSGYILNVEIESYDVDASATVREENELLVRYIKDIVSESHRCIVSNMVLKRIFVYVMNANIVEKDTKKSMQDIKLSAHIITALKENYGVNAAVGIGSIKPLSQIHISYEEAIRSLRYRQNRNIVRIEDVEEIRIPFENYLEIEENLLKNIKFGRAECVETFGEMLDVLNPLRDDVRRNKVFELLVLCAHEADISGYEETSYIDYMSCYNQIKDLDMEELDKWAINRFQMIIGTVQDNKINRKSETIQNALHFMENNYMHETSLEETASFVGVSPQYFSKVFKEEVGMKYIEWMTKLRIDKAKELLGSGKVSMKEICYMVGYNDPNYFSRIFKKIVGASPTEFVQKNDAPTSNKS